MGASPPPPTSPFDLVRMPEPALPPILPDYLRLGETAIYLRQSTRSVQRRIAAGDIPHVRVGGRTLVPRAALDAYLAALAERSLRTSAQTPPPPAAVRRPRRRVQPDPTRPAA